MNYYIGMDLHKNTSSFCVKDKDGNLISRDKIITNKDEVTKYVNHMKKLTENGQNLSLVVEPVSQWYFYADLLQNLGVDVHLANPLKVKAIASARIKNDAIDAGVLCDLLRTNLLPEAYFCSPQVRFWKEMTRYRASLTNLNVQLKNKVYAILAKNGLKCEFTRLFGVKGRRWLASLELAEQYQLALNRYVEMVDCFERLLEEADEKIEKTVNDHPQAKLLTTIPGISYSTALVIMAEIGDIKRFISPKKLMGYAGLVPSTYSSGERIAHGKITKTGSRWLRWTMVEVAHRQVLSKKKISLNWYYQKIKKRKGSSTAAVATARKLLAVVWTILKENRPYQERMPGPAGMYPARVNLEYQAAHREIIV